MKKSKILISSMMVILFSTTLLAGATYSLFTSSSSKDITVSSANVEVTSNIYQNKLALYSMGDPRPIGSTTFENGGTAKLVNDNKDIELSNITPGDEVRFKVQITNNSTVKIKYRVKVSFSSYVYGSTLTLEGNNASFWTDVNPETKTLSQDLSLIFKESANNDYKNADTTVKILVEARQANDPNADLISINFDANPSTEIVEPIKGKPGDEVILRWLHQDEHDHKRFDGWLWPNGEQSNEGDHVRIPNEDVTLKAIWKDVLYTLNIDTTKGRYGGGNSQAYKHINIPFESNITDKVNTYLNECAADFDGREVAGLYFNYDEAGTYDNDDLRFSNPVPRDALSDDKEDKTVYVKYKLKDKYHQLKIINPASDPGSTKELNGDHDYYYHEINDDFSKVNPLTKFIDENQYYYNINYLKAIGGLYNDEGFKDHFEKKNLIEDTVAYVQLCDDFFEPTYLDGTNEYKDATAVKLDTRIPDYPYTFKDAKYPDLLIAPNYYNNIKVTKFGTTKGQGLKEIVLPEYVDTIEGPIDCSKITYPANIEAIPARDKPDERRTYNVTFREGSLGSIGTNNFTYFNQDVIVIPDKVTTIGKFVFRDKKSDVNKVTNIFIGEGVTSVGDYSLCRSSQMPKGSVVNYYFKNPEQIPAFGLSNAGSKVTFNVYAPKANAEAKEFFTSITSKEGTKGCYGTFVFDEKTWGNPDLIEITLDSTSS